MAASMNSEEKDPHKKESIKNALSGVSRYLLTGRDEKLYQGLSYIRKKTASDSVTVEIFRDCSGISVFLKSLKVLVGRCSLRASKTHCATHDGLKSVLGDCGEGHDKDPDAIPSAVVDTTVSCLVEDTGKKKCDIMPQAMKCIECILSVLATCCYIDKKCQKKVASLLGIPLLAALFKTYEEDGLLNRLCRCLANLSSDDVIREEIVEEEVVGTLVSHLNGTSSEDSQRSYIRAIRLLGASKHGLSEIIKYRGVAAVASRIASTNAEVTKAAVTAVIDLSGSERFTDEAYEQVVVSKCLEHLVSMLSSTDPSLRHSAQNFIYKLLVKSDQIRAEFGNSGGIQFLYDQLKLQETRTSPLIRCLLWCTTESVNRIKIREIGALEMMLDFLRDCEQQSYHCDIIAGLCNFIYDDTSVQKLIDNDLIRTLLKVLLDVNQIPKLDLSRLVLEVSKTYSFHIEKECRQCAPRYSMHSPTYEDNQWECDLGSILCKTNFDPISFPSPPRSWSPSSGGYSPSPSTSEWTPPQSPSPPPAAGPHSPRHWGPQSPPSSPRHSPSPPPSPPSPHIPDPDDDPDSDTEQPTLTEPEQISKPHRASNHILLLLLRVNEISDRIFKDHSKSLTDSLFSYVLLTDKPSKSLWLLWNRLIDDAKNLTDILHNHWPVMFSLLLAEDYDIVKKALESNCCVQECGKDGCNVLLHCESTAVSSCQAEADKLMETLSRHGSTYYGSKILTQKLEASSNNGTGDDNLYLADVIVVCRTCSSLWRPLLKRGGLKSLVESTLLASEPRPYMVWSLAHFIQTLSQDHHQPVTRGHSETKLQVGERNRKRRHTTDSEFSPAAKRIKTEIGCFHDDTKNDVTFVLDNDVEIGATTSVLCKNSDVFQAMLRGHFSESGQRIVKLEDVDQESFEYCLHVLDGCQECEVVCRQMNIESLLGVLKLSDQYMMTSVRNHATERITKILDLSNIVVVLESALLFSCDDLIETCIKQLIRSHSDLGKKVSILDKLSEFSQEYKTDLSHRFVRVIAEIIIESIPERNRS